MNNLLGCSTVASFREPRTGEVPRIYLLGTWVKGRDRLMGLLAALIRVAAVYYLHEHKPPTTAQSSARRKEWIQAVIHLEGKPPLLPPPARVWAPPVPASSQPAVIRWR